MPFPNGLKPLCGALLAPWLAAAGLLGVAEAAFVQRPVGDADGYRWVGAGVTVDLAGAPPDWAVTLRWASAAAPDRAPDRAPDGAPGWTERGGGYGVRWSRGGRGPTPGGPDPAPARPPGAAADFFRLRVGLVWWLGLPAAGSLLAGRRVAGQRVAGQRVAGQRVAGQRVAGNRIG